MTPAWWTGAWWTDLWWWWLLLVALSWAGIEALSIVAAHLGGRRHLVDYTLSDTIRRWSSARRWLAPLTVAVACGLLWHFFGISNPT